MSSNIGGHRTAALHVSGGSGGKRARVSFGDPDAPPTITLTAGYTTLPFTDAVTLWDDASYVQPGVDGFTIPADGRYRFIFSGAVQTTGNTVGSGILNGIIGYVWGNYTPRTTSPLYFIAAANQTSTSWCVVAEMDMLQGDVMDFTVWQPAGSSSQTLYAQESYASVEQL